MSQQQWYSEWCSRCSPSTRRPTGWNRNANTGFRLRSRNDPRLWAASRTTNPEILLRRTARKQRHGHGIGRAIAHEVDVIDPDWCDQIGGLLHGVAFVKFRGEAESKIRSHHLRRQQPDG